MPEDTTVAKLGEGDWDLLVSRIKAGKCTPFLGAGIAADVLPTGRQVAKQWAMDPRFKYPLPDKEDLIKVSQFIALTTDALRPKELMVEEINRAVPPDFTDPNEPHGILARLPLPLYMTTNYDDFMLQALKKADPAKPRVPQQFINQWYRTEQAQTDAVDINATIDSPAVYYFHGYKDELETMVLTEDDYLDFLVRVSKDKDLIPPQIQKALTNTSLIFIGYSLSDMNFRVIFRGLVEAEKKTMRRISITVQIPSAEPQVVKYLTDYFGASGIRVYWGTAKEFLRDLSSRWEKAR